MVKCSKAEVRRLKTALRWKMPPEQRQRIQMVLLRESGLAQPAIAQAMGVSLSTVNRAHMAYDHGGIKALKPKPNGGRKHENMSVAKEKALLAQFAKAAGAGEMLNIHDLKAAYEKAIGHPTSDSTVYNLLNRHGWRKLMPRPFHPDRDIKAQNAFKKAVLCCCPECSARRGGPRSPFADHVRRRSAVRSDQQSSAVLGSNGDKAAGRLPAYSRIHLSLRRGMSKGWGLLLPDPAGCRHRMFPDISQHLG